MTRTTRTLIRPDGQNDFDTYLRSASPNDYYGNTGGIGVGRTGSEIRRGLIRFPLDDIPAGATITSATLRLKTTALLNANAYNIGAHRALTEWSISGSGSRDGLYSTWNNRIHSSTPWAGGAGGGSGSDYAATATATTSVQFAFRFYEWDVTADVAAFHSGAASNYGWWLINTDETTTTSEKAFYSGDNTPAGLRPALVVEWTEANTDDWYDDGWAYRKEITIDSDFVSADLTNFPLLVDLSADTDIAAEARPDLRDVVFTASDGMTRLDHELAGPAHGLATTDGAWSFFGDPTAVRYTGTHDKTYVGWVNAAGDVLIAAYNHGTAAWEGPTTLRAAFGADDHNAPSILVRDDGYIMVFYCKHPDTTVQLRISSNPEDISAFDTEQSLDADIGGDAYQYPTPIQLTGEVDDPIYLFWSTAGSGGASRYIRYSKSTDGGASWSAYTDIFYRNARSYYQAVQNGDSRVDFAITDVTPNDGAGDVLHFYYEGGNFYQSDGTQFAGTLPMGQTDITLVYDPGALRSWVWDIAIGSDGHPRIAFAVFENTYDHRYRYSRWTGSAWTGAEIVAGGSFLAGAEVYYSGGLSIDHGNPDVVYASVPYLGVHNIGKFVTVDGGATWTREAMLTNSTAEKNIRPVSVWNASAEIPLFWLHGSYAGYTSYATGVAYPKTQTPAKFWVRLPSIASAADTTFYVYYGNDDPAPQETSELVWRAYEVVVHGWQARRLLAGGGFPGTSGAVASTATEAAGTIYKQLSGSNHAVDMAAYINMRGWAAITVETLAAQSGVDMNAYISNWNTGAPSVLIRVDAPAKPEAFLITTSGQITAIFSDLTLTTNTVKRLAVRYDNANGLEAFEGKTKSAITAGAGSGTLHASANSDALWIAQDRGARRLIGSSEEVRVASTRLSDAWLNFVYDNIFDDTLGVGTEEEAPDEPGPEPGDYVPRSGVAIFGGVAMV